MTNSTPFIVLCFVFLLLQCGSISDEQKIRDAEEAFLKSEFRQEVIDNRSPFNEINGIITSNIDEIFNYQPNKFVRLSPSRDSIVITETKSEIFIFDKKGLYEKFPKALAAQLDSCWQIIGTDILSGINIKQKKLKISYSIAVPTPIETASNCRIKHRILYNDTRSSKTKINSVMESLTKGISLGNLNYYIIVEPYVGW